MQNLIYSCNGKTHDGVKVSVNVFYKQGALTLDAVRTCLVHGFACCNVFFNLIVCQVVESDLGGITEGFHPIICQYAYPCHYLVCFS